MEYTLEDVALPFRHELSLATGWTIIVKGKVKGSCERFHIDLECDGNIAFHFNPRPSENKVVRNTKHDGKWGREEREQPNFPFKPKEKFEIQIVVLEDCYRVYVNDNRFVDYRHRLPFSDVKTLAIDGGIKISKLAVHDKVSMPVRQELSLATGSTIALKGKVKGSCERFHINLECDSKPGGNIAFHFNPRQSENKVVRNSKRDGKWGREEREQPNFPFKPKEKFEIEIEVLEDCYRVNVNDKKFVDFSHRLPCSDVKTLTIAGGIKIKELSVHDKKQ